MMTKRVLSMILLVAISVSLAACQTMRSNPSQSKFKSHDNVQRQYVDREFNIHNQTHAPNRVYRLP